MGSYSVRVCERRNLVAMRPPLRPHARAPFADGGNVVVGHGDVEDRARPSDGWRIEVRPVVDARRELLKKRSYRCWCDASVEV